MKKFFFLRKMLINFCQFRQLQKKISNYCCSLPYNTTSTSLHFSKIINIDSSYPVLLYSSFSVSYEDAISFSCKVFEIFPFVLLCSMYSICPRSTWASKGELESDIYKYIHEFLLIFLSQFLFAFLITNIVYLVNVKLKIWYSEQ